MCLRTVMLMACVLATSARGEERWDFSGFASIGAGKLDQDVLEFMDYNESWSLDSDSVLGLQLQFKASDQLSFTGQAISKGFSYNEQSPYQPELSWLFASYEFNDALRMRAGRLRTPHFLYSESLDVGYSYPWVRPPVEMYADFLEPFSNFDGFDVSWYTDIAGNDTEVTFFGGVTENKFRFREIELHKAGGFFFQTRLESLVLRYCYNWNRLSIRDPEAQLPSTLFASLAEQYDDPAFAEVAEGFGMDRQVMQYHSIGVQWERDDWLVVAEKQRSIKPAKQFSFGSDGWYTTVGRQIGDFMPYVTLSEYVSEINPDQIRILRDSYERYPVGTDLTLDVLRELSLEHMLVSNVYQGAVTLGLRYDIQSNAAIKLEATQFDLRRTGQMIRVGEGELPSDIRLVSVVLDMVF